MRQVVSYLRVSTARQGTSGLGLEAQRVAVLAYCEAHGAEIVDEYREIESGRHNERPVLRQAIAYAKKIKGILVIAKLDRLARSVSFISNLMDSDIEFAACDLPEANRLLLHVMAAVGEAEAKAISDRTVAALAAAKARGTALGGLNPASRNLTQAAREKGARNAGQSLKAQARDAYADVLPLIQSLKGQGFTLQGIADELTEQGHVTRTGGAWGPVQVFRVLERAA
jgi:DNA invertase Pin-like site-specific DNA recombinase